jgi:D-cysteine desulfhydrase
MTRRLQLAALPTPIEPLHRLSDRLGVELRVKRDDLTGLLVSGNKVRKLEFLLAEALELGADTLITCGGAGSNHCRATAVIAARLGLGCRLLLRTPEGLPEPKPWTGNLLLSSLAGAELRFVTPDAYRDHEGLFGAAVAELEAAGHRPYVVPEGGSNALGAEGYAAAFEELLSQWPEADTVISAMGSGGTAAGLVLGRRRVGRGPMPVAVNVCDDEEFFRARIASILGDRADHDLRILDGFKGRGYARSSPEELDLIADVARTEGLFLDPVYTGKAFLGLMQTLASRPGDLGERVLFLHTGGVYGLFAEADALSRSR